MLLVKILKDGAELRSVIDRSLHHTEPPDRLLCWCAMCGKDQGMQMCTERIEQETSPKFNISELN